MQNGRDLPASSLPGTPGSVHAKNFAAQGGSYPPHAAEAGVGVRPTDASSGEPVAPHLSLLERCKAAVKRLKRQVLALYYAMQDDACPWYAKLLAGLAVAYVLSPLDLIPDFLPVIGLLDDIVLVAVILGAAIRVIPAEVYERAKQRAESEPLRLSKSWGMAAAFFLMWDALLLWLLKLALVHWGSPEVAHAWLWPILGATAAAMVLGQGVWIAVQLRRERRKERQAWAAAAAAEPLLGQPDRDPADP